MARFFRKNVLKKIGLPPGTLVHIGEKKEEEVKINLIDYDEKYFETREIKNVEECFPFKDTSTVTWINISGIHEIDILSNIGAHFGFHALVLEDILNTDQRPKIEDFEDHIFIILKMLSFNEETDEIVAEQISLFLGSNYVITFQEKKGDIFDSLRDRIKNGKGRVRKMGADYLAYALIDTIVDHYFIILEKLGDDIESLEGELVTNPTPSTLETLHYLRKEMIFLRKSVWPLREVINSLSRGESSLILEATIIYLRDVYDHTIQVIDTTETFRDIVSGMLDLYLSSVSNRMNEVMKVLTIIATIFIPLSFIAGTYGMNFEYMPELKWHWAYIGYWAIIAVVVSGMLFYFRRKRWL
jgi:magnesium transporter